MLNFNNLDQYKQLLWSTSMMYNTENGTIKVNDINSGIPDMLGMTKEEIKQTALEMHRFYIEETYTPTTVLERVQTARQGFPIYVDSNVIAYCIAIANGSDAVKMELCQTLGMTQFQYCNLKNSLEFYEQMKKHEMVMNTYEQVSDKFNEVCSSRGCSDSDVNILNRNIITRSTKGPTSVNIMRKKLGIPKGEPMICYANDTGLTHFTNVKQTSIQHIESENLNGFSDINKEVNNVAKRNQEPYKQLFDRNRANGLSLNKYNPGYTVEPEGGFIMTTNEDGTVSMA